MSFEIEFQSNVFDDIRNKLISAHCTVMLNVLTVTDDNHKQCIFPILSVNVLQSYEELLLPGYWATFSIDAVQSPSWSCKLSQRELDQPLSGWLQHVTIMSIQTWDTYCECFPRVCCRDDTVELDAKNLSPGT